MPLYACRSVLAAAALPLLSACAPPASLPPSGPAALPPREAARQVLDRLAFGPRPGQVDSVLALGIDRWIADQLHPERIPDTTTQRALDRLETQHASAEQLVADHVGPDELYRRWLFAGHPALSTHADSVAYHAAADTANRLSRQVEIARVLRAVSSDRQLLEVMTGFWENHFSVSASKMPNRYALVDYDRTIRTHALGRFRDLLGAVATSPAMLYYLDNWQSRVDSLHPTIEEARIELRRRARGIPDDVPKKRAGGINENYARELMELHTLGVDGGYTQHDVIEVARAFTGWTIDRPELGGGFVFREEMHDAGEKVVLGHVLPGGRGIEDGEEVLDILAASPATAHHVALKLAVHFVSDSPPPALVERAMRTYLRTGGDIREVVRTIVTSPEFFSRAAYRAKVKTPFEFVASALRAVGAPPDTMPGAMYAVAALGQPIFGHEAPDGWPDSGSAWMNTGALMHRINYGVQVARTLGKQDRLVEMELTAPSFERR